MGSLAAYVIDKLSNLAAYVINKWLNFMGTKESPKAYQDAKTTLASLQSNAQVLRSAEEGRRDPALHIPQVINYLKRVGIQSEDLEQLPMLHIAGTKGKGSTGAFAESILRHHGYKTGFFNSPHLIEDNERILLQGKPISKDKFSQYVFEIHRKLDQTKEEHEGDMPFYFSFMAVMAFYVFLKEKVDVMVVEVGLGGAYDSTNFVRRPTVCGVTSLDLDHTFILGDTLEKIAWQKAGIFKLGVPAFTVEQHHDGAMKVLQGRAKEIGCPLYVVRALTAEEVGGNGRGATGLGIAGERQLYNAALALHMTRIFRGKVSDLRGWQDEEVTDAHSIPRIDSANLSAEERKGLQGCYWPGRAQTIVQDDVTFYLDGAHTPDSVEHCVRWFQTAADKELKDLGLDRSTVSRALVFNITGKRDVPALLSHLKGCGFEIAAFCPNTPQAADGSVIPDDIKAHREEWDKLAQSASNCTPSIELAFQWAKTECCGKQRVQILVTGSLYLVGGALKLLSPRLFQ